MLGQIPRPGLTSAESARSAPVFWKTGTSHGFRDAWSVAVFDHYVLAVWIGNFDGKRNACFHWPHRRGAAPFPDDRRLPRLPAVTPGTTFAAAGAEPKAGRVLFCLRSIADGVCPHRTEGWFIPGISPIATCDVHREILVDASTGLRVAQDDGSRDSEARGLRILALRFARALRTRRGPAKTCPHPSRPRATTNCFPAADIPPKINLPGTEMTVSQRFD